jgi:acyl-CoA synthetase (AMP-forming)/AMP-acid ligase II
MKSINLRARVAQIADVVPNRHAVVTSRRALTYKQALCHVPRTSGEHAIIFCDDPANVLRALVACDGSMRSVCALSPALGDETLNAILSQYDFDCFITDRAFSNVSTLAVAGLEGMSAEELVLGEAEGSPTDSRETTWLVPTSGTTAHPKLVVHTLASLAKAGLKVSQSLEEPQMWGLFYDMTRFAGYQVLFQAVLAGHTLVCPDLMSTIEERVSFCSAHGVTHISATPTLWRKILMCPMSQTLSLIQISLGGEAADQTILSALRKAYPRARVTHVYASTEAGVAISVSDGRAGFPLSFVEANTGDPQIAIKEGKLFVRSKGVAQGYVGESSANDSEGWVDTGDVVRVEDDRFFVVGRESGVLNIGGDKVMPDDVRRTLLACELVSDAVVYGKRNPITGSVVAADIKLAREMAEADARAAIDSWLRDRLATNQRPRLLRFVREINFNSNGKIVV